MTVSRRESGCEPSAWRTVIEMWCHCRAKRVMPLRMTEDVGHSQRTRRALGYMLGAALSLSLMNSIVKMLGQKFPTSELLLARTAVSLLLSYVWLRRLGLDVWGNDKRWLLLRGLVGFFALAGNFYALPRMPLAEATVIQYLHPMFTALLAALFLGEGLLPRFWLGTVACLIGVVLVARPGLLFGADTALPTLPVLASLLSAGLSACAYTIVRKLGATEHPLVIVMYFPLVAFPLTIPLVAMDFVPPAGMDWFWLLMVGVTTQVGQVSFTRGLQLVPAARAASMAYVQVIFAALWGVMFFAEHPSVLAVLGGACIVLGNWVIQRHSGDRAARAGVRTRSRR